MQGDGEKKHDYGENLFTVGLSVIKGNDNWIIDSGASQHTTSNGELLVNYKEFPVLEPVVLGDSQSVDACGSGEIRITMVLGHNEKYEKKSTVTKVLYVSKLTTNLFSASAVTAKGNVVKFRHTLLDQELPW